MTAVSNKTQKPLCVTLQGGKTLHLGPGKTGQISTKAAQDPQIKKLVDAGEIEVVSEDARPTAGPGSGKKGRTFMYGHSSGGGIRRSGDR
jgi:hypothetical protein